MRKMVKFDLGDKKTIEAILCELNSEGFRCFSSESQFRDLFALKIARSNEDFIIIPEFSPPKDTYPDTKYFKSKKSIRFDLLVIDNSTNKKYLFEFKYKTKSLKDVEIMSQRFDLCNQNDFTNGRYDVKASSGAIKSNQKISRERHTA